MRIRIMEALPAILKKSEMFNSMAEEFHGARISDLVKLKGFSHISRTGKGEIDSISDKIIQRHILFR